MATLILGVDEDADRADDQGTHPGRARVLSVLAGTLLRRFELTGDAGSLDESLEVAREAVDLTPHGHPDMSTRLNVLDAALGRNQGRSQGDIDFDRARTALELFLR